VHCSKRRSKRPSANWPPPQPTQPPRLPTTDASNPLTDLLAHITQHANEQPEATQLRSIARFQDTWARLSTEQQLTQTLAQAPENAGPMNSQHLVLRSLQRMHDIAPDYLQSFMSYIDTLIWLESAARPSAGEREKQGTNWETRNLDGARTLCLQPPPRHRIKRMQAIRTRRDVNRAAEHGCRVVFVAADDHHFVAAAVQPAAVDELFGAEHFERVDA
jgi:hypothetical protein